MMISGLGVGDFNCNGGNMGMRLAQAALPPYHHVSLQHEGAIHQHSERAWSMNQEMGPQQTPNLQIP